MSHAIAWGDVPTWLGAITTTLALIGAGWVVAIELRRDRTAERDKHAGQARLVAGWTDPAENSWVTLRNASSLPVYDVHVHILSVKESWKNDFEPRERGHGRYTARLDVLPPGDTPLSEVIATKDKSIQPPASKPYQVGISFTDARGNRWMREHGRLIQVLNDRTKMVVDK